LSQSYEVLDNQILQDRQYFNILMLQGDAQRVSTMTKKLFLFFVVLLALVEIVLCTGRQRQRILVADGASESEQNKINQGKEALESIDHRVSKYQDISPKTRNTIYGKTKG
jgi:hypothetical protein